MTSLAPDDVTASHSPPLPRQQCGADAAADALWYHPHVDREQAEHMLLACGDGGGGGGADGVFLVRDSATAPGDLVISVRSGAGVLHYQVRQHDQDAIYSVNDCVPVLGIDALIERYRGGDRHCSGPCLAVPLGRCLPGRAAPSALCRQGSGNLLHRATVAGDARVVAGLISSHYPQLHGKDERGQTAVHLAAALNRVHVLRLLLNAGCTVNVRDANGLTPLHHAARHNCAQAVHVLVEEGQASVVAREPRLLWLPLHEAAQAGAEAAVRALIAERAALRPRDRHDRTPAQLAAAAGHSTCQQLLQWRHQLHVPRHLRSSFLHGSLSRQQTRARLAAAGLCDGDFLVRGSARQPGRFALSLVSSGRVYHFVVGQASRSSVDRPVASDGDDCCDGDQLSYFHIDDGPYLDSLEHLVDHYSCVSDGLVCQLVRPVPPPAEEALRAVQERRRFLLGDDAAGGGSDQCLAGDLPLLSLAELEFGAVIGRGQFGCVYHGCYRPATGALTAPLSVAIKRRRTNVAPPDNRQGSSGGSSGGAGVWREARCLQQLCHPSVVRFVGVVQHTSLLLVQELAPLGSLLHYLRQQPATRVAGASMRLWASQVADGMAYMQSRRVVHRDLAARNILLASPMRAKISDFGFSLMLAADRDYYRVSSGGRWPVKWYSPESMNYGTFSSASDVWSFGVLVWEVYSRGDTPFGAMSGVDAFLNVIEQGGRLPRPTDCPSTVYRAMLSCWAYEPTQRPSFAQLHEFLSGDADSVQCSWLSDSATVSLIADDVASVSDSAAVTDTDGTSTPPLSPTPDAISSTSLELYDSPRVHTLSRISRRASASNAQSDSTGSPSLCQPDSAALCQLQSAVGRVSLCHSSVSHSQTGAAVETADQAADNDDSSVTTYDSPRFHSLNRPRPRPSKTSPRRPA